jgi:hypothetical protein
MQRLCHRTYLTLRCHTRHTLHAVEDGFDEPLSMSLVIARSSACGRHSRQNRLPALLESGGGLDHDLGWRRDTYSDARSQGESRLEATASDGKALLMEPGEVSGKLENVGASETLTRPPFWSRFAFFVPYHFPIRLQTAPCSCDDNILCRLGFRDITLSY